MRKNQVLSIVLAFSSVGLFSCKLNNSNSASSLTNQSSESISHESLVDSSINSSSLIDDSSSIENQIYHSVKFVNYDGSELYVTEVLHGDKVEYKGETPTKKADDEFTYEFKGWDIDLNNILKDELITAQYDAKPKTNWGEISWF